jgi:hypothetical protein
MATTTTLPKSPSRQLAAELRRLLRLADENAALEQRSPGLRAKLEAALAAYEAATPGSARQQVAEGEYRRLAAQYARLVERLFSLDRAIVPGVLALAHGFVVSGMADQVGLALAPPPALAIAPPPLPAFDPEQN